jgi:hypothetical protein
VARIFLWIAFIAATAFVPAFAIGRMTRLYQWSERRCRWTTAGTVIGIWIFGWFVIPMFTGAGAPFGLSTFAWVAEDSARLWQSLWIFAPILAPHLARKVAFPELSFWSDSRELPSKSREI